MTAFVINFVSFNFLCLTIAKDPNNAVDKGDGAADPNQLAVRHDSSD